MCIRDSSPPDPVEKNIFRINAEEKKALGIESLPRNLGEALEYMEKSSLVKEALGTHLFEHFLYIKGQEWDTYRAQVSDWEVKNLLPSL